MGRSTRTMGKKPSKKKNAAAVVVEDPTESFLSMLATLEAISLLPGQDPEEVAFEFMLAVYEGSDSWGERERWSHRKDPTYEFEVNDVELTLRQSWQLLSEAGNTGAGIWDAAVVMAKFLERWAEPLGLKKGAHCMELGAGCGLAGLAAVALGGKCTLTDRGAEDTVSILRSNASRNFESSEMVRVCEYTWGEAVPENSLQFAIGSDLLVCDASIEPLVDALMVICGDGTKMWLTAELRNQDVFAAFVNCAVTAGLRITRIPSEMQHQEYCAPYVVLMMIDRVALVMLPYVEPLNVTVEETRAYHKETDDIKLVEICPQNKAGMKMSVKAKYVEKLAAELDPRLKPNNVKAALKRLVKEGVLAAPG